jgi:predicted phage terminase large subunit-like protein
VFQDFKQLIQKKLANYKPFENIAPVDETLEELARGDISRTVITLPSQHTKSSTTDIFAAYMIGLNPLIRCICATYSQKLARKHSRAIKDVINSMEFEEYFGWKPVFKKDAEDEWELEWPGKSQGSTFLARSVESPALGETADLLIIDDPLSGGNAAYSPTKQERAAEAIRNVLLQRLTPEGKVVVISTLWTEADPAIWMMEGWKASATPATYVNLAALNEDGTASFRQNIVTGEREYIDAYAVLWPEYRDLKFIEAKRKEMRAEDFETQYMGNPIATGGLASEVQWGIFEEAELQNGAVQYAALIVDTGIERGEFNDPTLSLAVGYGPRGYYVMDSVQGKWSVAEIVQNILRQMERVARRLGALEAPAYPFFVPAILIEQAALGRPCHDELVGLLVPCDIVRLVSPMGMPKEIRARAQSHHIQAGRVFLPKHGDFVRELKRQWVSFPRGKHDEYVDCLSYAIQHARNVHLLWSKLHMESGRQVGQYSEPHERLRPPTEFEMGHVDVAPQQSLVQGLLRGDVGPDDLEEEMARQNIITPDFYAW